MINYPKVIIVIPTYNERDTLGVLVERINALNIPNCSMLVVDDNSPDGTGLLADELTKKYPLRVIHRPMKEGLGKAYVSAFREIVSLSDNQRPEYVIQMDADLSHNPADIPRFLEKIKDNDIVLGSRYMEGGRVEEWGLARKLISRFGNIYARIILGVSYRDLTSGYKCFRFEVLRDLDLNEVGSVGYNFQIEVTFLAHKKGFQICEIPIVFVERKSGSSKFNPGIILESFLRVLRMRF